jgi:hypothetical protein
MSNKPLPRKKRVENRGYQYSRNKKDKVNNVSVTLKDIDSSIIYYLENVIKPSVEENGEHIKVPVLYGSVERWKAILRDGFLRDKKRQIITPAIVFKRNTININETIPQDKLDANNPHLFYPFQKKYSQVNRYDNLATQIGTVLQREYYNVSFPDYVTLTYDFIIWTSFIEQMNKIVERINYSDGAYWGNPEKMRFRSTIDSFDDATEIGEAERLIRTNFNVTINGYLLAEKGLENKPTIDKFITPKKVTFHESVTVELD